MINVLQRPQEINYSQSLPEIILTSDKGSVSMDIKIGSAILIQERYDVGANNNPIKIKLRKLLDHLLTNDPPQYHLDVSTHQDAIKTFQIELNDEDLTPVGLEFKMINGFNRFQPYDLQTFFNNNWLNLTPDTFEAYFHQPLFLTAYPAENLAVKVKAMMIDGTSKTRDVGSLTANNIQSININPGKLQQILEGVYTFAEIYAINSSGNVILGSKKIFYQGLYPFKADIFFYLNRLGGWDTLVLSGEHVRKQTNTPSNAIIDESEFQYDSTGTLEFEKTTGYISTKAEEKQFTDFIYSKSKFHLYEGSLIPITTDEIQISHAQGAINSYTFSFRPANTLEYYPDTRSLTSHLLIT